MSAAAPPPPTAPPAGEGRLDQLIARLSDGANPIAVRTVRQRLRSRAFLVVFSAVLGLATLVSLAVAAEAAAGREAGAGLLLFGLLAAIWTFAVWVYEPLNAYRAVASERDAATWDLIRLTGMSPGRLLRGMFLASLLQHLLYASALAPFVVMAYLLRGVDLVTIGVALVFIPLAGACASAGAILLGSLAAHRTVRTVLGALVAVGTGLVWFVSLTAWLNFAYIGQYVVDDLVDGPALPLTAASALLWILSALTLGAAALQPPSANRSTGPRLLAWFTFANALAWLAVASPSVLDALAPAGAIGAATAALLGVFALAEDEAISPRQAREAARMPWWQLPWLFAPGAARGRRAYVALTALSLLTAAAPVALGVRGSDEDAIAAGLIAAYAAILLAVSDLLARTWLARTVTTPLGRRLLTLGLVGASSFAGVVLVAFDDGDTALSLLSPVPGLWIATDAPGRFEEAIVAILALGAASLVAIAIRGLRPTPTVQRLAHPEATP